MTLPRRTLLTGSLALLLAPWDLEPRRRVWALGKPWVWPGASDPMTFVENHFWDRPFFLTDQDIVTIRNVSEDMTVFLFDGGAHTVRVAPGQTKTVRGTRWGYGF